MRARRLTPWSAFVAVAAVVVLFGFITARVAHADAKAKKEIEQKMTEAMENYDLLEYEEARKILNLALTIAKKAKMESDPVTAKVHLRLGIVYFAGLQDPESAKLSFGNAVEIDKGIALDKAYATPEMQRLLEEARAEFGGGGTGGGGGDTGGGGGDTGGGGGDATMDVTCADVVGIKHTIIEEAKGGKPLAMAAAAGADVAPTKMAIMYRPRGATDFTEARMTLTGECVYTGAIPADALKGDIVHYYVAAYNAEGKLLASKGSAGSPNIIEVTGSAGGRPDDNEDPLGGGSGGSDPVTTPRAASAKKTLFVAIVGGAGGGLVSGKTEQQDNTVKCCFAPEPIHVVPEIGFYLSPQTAVSIAARIGLPLGANIMGHATVAPGALVRVTHWFAPTGAGLHVVGGIGGGIMRDTIKLEGAAADADTDIVAMGPLWVNAGAGYSAALGPSLALVAQVNAIVGVPVVSEVGASVLNFGVHIDANLGLAIGF